MRALSLSQVGLALHYLSSQAGQQQAPTALTVRSATDRPKRASLITRLTGLKRSRAYIVWLLQRELEGSDLPLSRTGPYRNH